MPTVLLSFEEIAPFLGAVESPALSVTLPPPYMFSPIFGSATCEGVLYFSADGPMKESIWRVFPL